jgi:hypothetical protein
MDEIRSRLVDSRRTEPFDATSLLRHQTAIGIAKLHFVLYLQLLLFVGWQRSERGD